MLSAVTSLLVMHRATPSTTFGATMFVVRSMSTMRGTLMEGSEYLKELTTAPRNSSPNLLFSPCFFENVSSL